MQDNKTTTLAELVRDYAENVACRFDLDDRATDALTDLVQEAAAGWTVAELLDPSDRAWEAADSAAPIYYSDQAALLTDPFSLAMVTAGVDAVGLEPFDASSDDFYQWTCKTAAGGWVVTLAEAMGAALRELVEVDGLRALGLSEDAAEVAAQLVRDGSWDGNLAGLHLSADLLNMGGVAV